MTITQVICSWCGRLIRECAISHGICPECAVKVFGEVV